jgi:type I restriction enzyme S subunit
MFEPFAEKPLGEIADLVMGQSPDSQYVHEGLGHGFPFLQGNAEFGDVHPHPLFSCSQPARVCRRSDVLISVRAPVGEINIADANYCIGRGLAAIRFRAIPPTLGAKLVSKFSPSLKRVAQGTTFEAIGKNDLASLRVLVPPAREWATIAQILDTLDIQIRQTEALIAKLECIKQGLLTDLLTRGIDQNGQLRPTPDQAPRLYKDSPLGRIPREWEVRTLEELAEAPICYGIVQVGAFVADGVPVLAIKNLRKDFSTDINRADRRIEAAYSRSRIQTGDVLLSIKGSTGRVDVVPSEFAGNISRDIARIRPCGMILSAFLCQFLRSPLGQKTLAKAEVGTTRAELSIGPLRNTPVPAPNLHEQKIIVSAVDALERQEKSESSHLETLRQLKNGLMDHLLTGRVRVTPLLDTAEQALG